MAATNTTTNYGFPLYNESDSTSWADFNKLSTDADAKIKEVADAGGTTNGQVQELTTKVDTLTQSVNAQDAVITQQGTEITALKNDAATTDEAIDGLQQKANANETNISNLSTQVTGTILPKVEKNTTDIAKVTGNATTLSATVSQQGSRITSLEGKVPNDLTTKLTTLTNGLNEVEGDIEGGFKVVAGPTYADNYGFSKGNYSGSLIISYEATSGTRIGLYLVDMRLSIHITPSQKPRLVALSVNNSSGLAKVISTSPSMTWVAATSDILNVEVNFVVAINRAGQDGYLDVAAYDLSTNSRIQLTPPAVVTREPSATKIMAVY